jgi:hypothetical protein
MFYAVEIPKSATTTKNAKLKLLKTKAVIWFNKIFQTKQLTPKYFSIELNGNNKTLRFQQHKIYVKF